MAPQTQYQRARNAALLELSKIHKDEYEAIFTRHKGEEPQFTGTGPTRLMHIDFIAEIPSDVTADDIVDSVYAMHIRERHGMPRNIDILDLDVTEVQEGGEG